MDGRNSMREASDITYADLDRLALAKLASIREEAIGRLNDEDVALFNRLNDGSFVPEDYFAMLQRKLLLLDELARQEAMILGVKSETPN